MIDGKASKSVSIMCGEKACKYNYVMIGENVF